MAQSQLFDNLKKVINLVDQLRDLGLQKYISMPRIVVVGSQSSGKSSLLEQIVGLDFLPRGSGVVTRRPLELRLINKSNLKNPYGKFDEIPNKEFTDFQEIKKNIESLTDKVAGNNKEIVDKPIILTVWSSNCPDLTLIDLPGITRISLQNQGTNIEKITKEMATRYCKDPKTIMMCVTPANTDISNSDGLQLARQLDPEGNRTIGVLTKIDIMDKGTSAKGTILGKEIELKLGFVGIKNRSQQDIIDNRTVQYSLEQERKFFSQHPVYSTLPQGYTGTHSLTNKLTSVLYQHIREFLPELIREIRNQIETKEKRLSELGTALPDTDQGKLQYLWKIINEFSSCFKNKIQGKYDKFAKYEKNEVPPGSKMRLVLADLYNDLSTNQSIENYFSDQEISKAIQYHEGGNLPGFPSIDAFKAVLTPKLQSLLEPANETIREIYEYLEEVAVTILAQILEKAPAVKDCIQEFVIQHIQQQQNNTEKIVKDLIDSEVNYIFTNNEQYFQNERPKKIETNQPQQQQRISGNPMVAELKFRLTSYFKLVVKNVRDTIPKTIGYFLIKKTQESMQQILFQTMQKKSQFYALMQEPTHIVEERKTLGAAIKTMKAAERHIKKDPDFSVYSRFAEKSKSKPKPAPPAKEEQPKVVNPPASQRTNEQNQVNDFFGVNPNQKTNPPPSGQQNKPVNPPPNQQQRNPSQQQQQMQNNFFGNPQQQQNRPTQQQSQQQFQQQQQRQPNQQQQFNQPPKQNNMFSGQQQNNLAPPPNQNTQQTSPRPGGNPPPQQNKINPPPQQQPKSNNYVNQPQQNSANNVGGNPLNKGGAAPEPPKKKKPFWNFD